MQTHDDRLCFSVQLRSAMLLEGQRASSILFGFCLTLFTLTPVSADTAQPEADELLPVDCLLPGSVRKIAGNMTYITQRRPVKTSAVDCEIRGGEYTQFDRANYETAMSIWLPMADMGDAEAQNYVGEIHEKGLGVKPDYAMAAQWYRKAAEQGHRAAQTNLGQLYELGLGVDHDMEQALAWYRKAANIDGKTLKFVSYDYSDEHIEDMETRLLLSETQLTLQTSRISHLAKELDASEARYRRAERQLAGKKAALDKELATLADRRENMERQQADVQALRDELKAMLLARAETERQVSEQQANAQQTARIDEAELTDLRARLAGAEDNLAGLQAELSEREQALTERELALKQKDLKLSELSATNQQLQSELEGTRSTLSTIQSQQEVEPLETAQVVASNEPPEIRMIEPPLVSTRDAADTVVVTRSGLDQRTVIGQVISANPVLEVMVNEESVDFDDKGMFQHRVPLTRSVTDVNVVAVDVMGLRSDLAFMLKMDYVAETDLFENSGFSPESPKVLPVPDIDFGNYHALVIGNSDYKSLPRLNSTVVDAEAISQLLGERYGFNVTTLLNATRYDILSALNTLREKLSEDDNLLIYFAGHGELDEVNNRGHWLPVDAEESSTANWISNVAITDILNAMAVRKVLVIADSCYSGAMTRSTLARLDAGRSMQAWTSWLKLITEKRSRLSFSSGGLAPVMDGGGGRHSIFAKALIDALENNKGVMEGRQLYSQVAQAVSYAAEAAQFEQAPQYAPIRFAGHEAGDFLFVSR
ncbi:caspase family protein [Allohahella marinimesophila]|uniref:Caspase family p20 domain-containing protein n=1 Tax=Allohahella marinimesophila TaxID=1054972 RepID=A0ABP7PHB7_9GAMM